MYRKYFGLNSLPFKTTPELEMFYKQGSRQEILEAMLYTISRGDGIVKVTGEVGSGKTMLLRLLANKLDDKFEVIYINSPNLSSKDILFYICSELEIEIDGHEHKFKLTNLIKTKLLEIYSLGKRVVMLVDEAQSMSYDALEELRLLSNIETENDKLLQMVLFGQPELDTALESEKIRQLKSRISYNIFVPHLNSQDVQAYLNYRMRKAGYVGLDVFDLKVSKKIQAITSGLPRNINIVADKVLMSVFSSGDKVAKVKHLKNLPLLEGKEEAATKTNNVYYFIISTLVVVVLFLAYLLISSGKKPIESQKNAQNSIHPEEKITSDKLTLSELPPATDIVEDRDLKNSVETDNTIIVEKEIASAIDENHNRLYVQNTIEPDIKQISKIATSPINYNIKNLNAIYGNITQLEKVLGYHSAGVEWLNDLKDNYVIQLSTRNIQSLDATIDFYSKQNIELNKIHFLLDYNRNIKKFRIKVFYLSSSSFSYLNSELDQLPLKMKVSSPYVGRTDQLVQNLQYTEKQLEKIGIVNE